MKTMAYQLFNHIKGKNGSRWTQFIREHGAENILVVAIDAAKYINKALLCNLYGDVYIRPFEFDATMQGFKGLLHHIEAIKKEESCTAVVIGIETTGHYYEDLVRLSSKEGYMVRVINAATTAEERKSLLNSSKTDNLDLLAIVQSIIHGRGQTSDLPFGRVAVLRKLTRMRREYVNQRTATGNAILGLLDHIFREYQGKKIKVNGEMKKVKLFSDVFGKASRYILRHYPHPMDILELGKEGLREISQKENLKIRDDVIHLLLKYARESISKPKEDLKAELFMLPLQLDQYEMVDKQIALLEREIEDILIDSEGAVFLTVSGMGVVTSAELYAEMGDITDFDHAGQIIKMAGTNPVVKQSGGNRPSYYAISKQGRKQFRNVVFQVGRSLSANNPDMKKKYQALKERGKQYRQAYVAIGNRMIRLAFSMLKNHTLYKSSCPDYVLIEELKKKVSRKNVKQFYEKHVSVASEGSA
jgi:transposase